MQIITTIAEHHSNFVVWQQLCDELGGTLVVLPIDAEGQVDIAAFEVALKQPTGLVAIHMSATYWA